MIIHRRQRFVNPQNLNLFRQGSANGLSLAIYDNNEDEVIIIEDLKQLAVIRQQIALNSSMFEAGRIPGYMHDHAKMVLLGRLTKAAARDNIIDDENISHSKMI